LTLLAAMLVILLGHVCALPESAHVDFLGTGPGHHHEDTGETESHIASCDATVMKSAQLLPVLIAATCAVSPGPTPLMPRSPWTANAVPRIGLPPPLFLLHASFLI
jgi:hypothetical protein